MPYLPPDPAVRAVRDEIAVMRRIAAAYAALDDLDDLAADRVVRWAADRWRPDRQPLPELREQP